MNAGPEPEPQWALPDRLLLESDGFRVYDMGDGVIGGIFAPHFLAPVRVARLFTETLRTYRETHASPVGFLLLGDGIVQLPKETRRYFQNEDYSDLILCNAVVNQSLLARAIGAIFGGLLPLGFPTRQFRDADDALKWVQEVIATHHERAAS